MHQDAQQGEHSAADARRSRLAVDAQRRAEPAPRRLRPERWPPLVLTMLWIVGIPTVFVFGNDALAAVPFLNVTRGVYVILAGLLAARMLTQPRTLQRLGGVEKAMAIYLAIVVVSWMTTVPEKNFQALKDDAALLLEGFLMPCTAFVLARNTAWTRSRLIVCLWVLVAGVGTYLVVTGCIEYAYGANIFASRTMKMQHPHRVTGSFVNALQYGMVLFTILLLALVLYLHTHRQMARVFLIGLVAGLTQAIVFSKGRAVWLAVPIGLLLVSLRRPRVRLLGMLITLAILVQLLVSTMVPAARQSHDSLSRRLTNVSPLYNRVAIGLTVSNMIAHRPLFGFGFGVDTVGRYKAAYYRAWGRLSEEWVARWAAYPRVAHNEFLSVFVLTGVVGLAAYLALLWFVWRTVANVWVRCQESDPFRADLALCVQGAFVVIMLNALFLDLMFMTYVLILFYFLLGIVSREPVLPRPASPPAAA